MLNYQQINNLIDSFYDEVQSITFQKSEHNKNILGNTGAMQSTNNSITNNHYVDNSWNSYYDNRTFITNASPNKENKKDDQNDDKKKDKKEEGNNPIIFLIASGALALGATYLIATDDYRKITKKFSDLDELLIKIGDKTKNTLMENKYIELKEYYEKLKVKLLSKYSPSYYSKWGIVGSSLVTLTYFFPFGTIALIPGIIGLTGFGCYWLWNHLTSDEFEEIIKHQTNLLKFLDLFRKELDINCTNQEPYNTPQFQPQFQQTQSHNWNVVYNMGTAPLFENEYQNS